MITDDQVLLGAVKTVLCADNDGEPVCEEICPTCLEEWHGILKALDAAGLAIVPREPTEEMLWAGFNVSCGSAEKMLGDDVYYENRTIYKAMLEKADE